MENIEWKYGLAWSDEYETGYEEIDNQHKRLFKLVSDLIESCQRNDNKIAVGETLSFLVDYAGKHFEDEERIAGLYNYPQQKQHKKIHEDFSKTVALYVERYNESGDSDALFIAVNKIIARWLVEHIQGEDIKIAQRIQITLGKNL